MVELLFENIIQKEALENLLALNQIKKCDKEIEKYTEEINELNKEMSNILKDENIDESYIEKMSKYKSLINKKESDTLRMKDIDDVISESEARISEYESKIKNIEERLNTLKEEIFKTDDPAKVIDCQNEIENCNVRLNDLNEILNQLINNNTPLLIEKEYLIAKNNDYDLNIPNHDIDEMSSDLEKINNEFNKALEELDLPVRENIEFCQKKISNREKEIEKYTSKKNEVLSAYPKALSLDLSNTYSQLDKLLGELNLHYDKVPEEYTKNVFEEETQNEVKKEEPEVSLFNDDEVVEPVITEDSEEKTLQEEGNLEVDETKDDESFETENNDDTSSEETKVEEPEEEKTENSVEDEVASVSYVLSDGESLINIAEKVYPSKDNWEAIYYFNKDAINKYLISNGINTDFDTVKSLAEDTNIFAGIKLEIPTDYNYKA